ncbi:uncharacterized protein LOC143214749 [Lasioglossum baleicum]|uniref:uncharacterized protein LOC143214749 n=1 Tax=Lasioglossum baleicum TaxID=434251 RepID=UPI003FCD9E5A
MVQVSEVPCRGTGNLNKPQDSIFGDENLLYLQPATRRPITYNRPYRKPTIKIGSDTTYNLSYLKFDQVPRRRFNYGDHEKLGYKTVEKMATDTVYKLSYEALKGKIPQPFLPRPRLFLEGSRDMTTTQMMSYMNPGRVQVKRYKPYRGKHVPSVPMESETITKGSYQNFATPIVIKRPRRATFWQTKVKSDYHTTSQLSYQFPGLVPGRIRIKPKRAEITARMEDDTIFRTSYKIPGRLVRKENVCE